MTRCLLWLRCAAPQCCYFRSAAHALQVFCVFQAITVYVQVREGLGLRHLDPAKLDRLGKVSLTFSSAPFQTRSPTSNTAMKCSAVLLRRTVTKPEDRTHLADS